MDVPLGMFGSLYAICGIVTFGVVIRWGSWRLPKWLDTLRPESAKNWVFGPLLGLLGVTMVAVGMWATVVTWPVVAAIGYQKWRRSQARQRLAAEEEERELLEEVRRQRSLQQPSTRE